MASQVEQLSVGYSSDVAPNAKADEAALRGVADAATVVEERVRRASKSGEALARQYGESERLAAKLAEVTRRYARELSDLEDSELSAADKAKLYANIMAQREAAMQKATAAHDRWVAGMRAAEAAASAQAAGMAAATASANTWAGALAKVYETAGATNAAVNQTARVLQAINADFQAGRTSLETWATAAKGLENALRGVSAAQRAINENTGVSRQNVNTATIGPLKYAVTGAGASSGNTLSLVTGDAEASARRQRDIEAAFAESDAALAAYREELGLVDVAQKRFAAGQAELEAVIHRSGVAEAEGTRLLTAYAAAHDPAIAKAKALAAAAFGAEASRAARRTQIEAETAAIEHQLRVQEAADARDKARVAAQSSIARSLRRDQIEAETRALEQQMKIDAASAARKEAEAVQTLIDKLNPAAVATRKLAESEALLQKAADGQVRGVTLSADQHAVLVQRLRETAGANDRAARSMKLTAAEATNLSFQIQDIGVSLAGGQNPILVMAQQLPQATMAVGGLQRAMALLMTSTAALALGATAVVGGFVGAGLAALKYSNDVREVERASRLTGGAVGMTTGALLEQADAAAAAAGISRSSAREIQTAYVNTGRIGGDVLGRLTATTKDWASLRGIDIDKATDELAGYFEKPGAAADDLTKKFNLFSNSQRESIHAAEAQGRIGEAQKLLLDGIGARARGAAGHVSDMTKAWEAAGRASSNFIDSIGQSAGMEAVEQRVRRLSAELERLRAASSGPTGGVTSGGDADVRRQMSGQPAGDYRTMWATGNAPVPAPLQTRDSITKLTAEEQKVADLYGATLDEREQALTAFANRQGDNVRRLEDQLADFAKAMDPTIKATQDLKIVEQMLNDVIAASPGKRAEATRALALYKNQVLETIAPTQAFAREMERQARVMEAAAGRARDFETERQKTLERTKRAPTDALTPQEEADINKGLDRKYAAQGADRHRTMTEAIDDARLLARAQGSLSQTAVVTAQAQVEYNRVLRETKNPTLAAQAAADTYTKGMVDLSGQIGAQVAQAQLAVASTQRLADAQATGGDLAMAQARAENVLAESLARGVPAAQAMALAVLDYQKSLAEISGQQRAWNRDMVEQIAAAERVAQAEAVSGAAVGEANLQNKIRAQILREGVPLESDRARAIEAGARALEAQNAAAKVNNAIRGQNQDLVLARAEYDLLGSTNAERERSMGILRATLEVQNDPAWAAAPEETRQAWIRQAGAVAEYRSRIEDAKAAGADFAASLTKGLEDIIVSGGKAGDIMKELGKSMLRGGVREVITKPLNEMMSGFFTKLLAPKPLNDNMVPPVAVNDNDPNGSRRAFAALSDATSAGLGTPGKPMWVQLTNGSAALAMPQATAGQPMPVAVQNVSEFDALFAQAGAKYGLDPALLRAVAQVESSTNPWAVNSRSGAAGLMQIMPANFSYLGGASPYDPAANVDAGARILKEHLTRAGGDLSKALSTYSGHVTTSGASYVAAVRSAQEAYAKADRSVIAFSGSTRGVTAAQEAALQAQLDALPVQQAAASASQDLTAAQQASVDGALAMLRANDNAAGSIDVQARAMDKLAENAVSAAEQQAQAGDLVAQSAGGIAGAFSVAGSYIVSGAQSLLSMLGSLFSSSASSGASVAGGQQQQSGTIGLANGTGQVLQLGQQAYNIYSGTNTLGTMATRFATSSLGSSLGLSMSGQAAAMAAGGTSATAAGVMGVPGGVTAGTPVLSGAGTAFTGAASTIGAAAPYGMIGGMGGAYLSNQFMGGSKIGGAVSGAAIGAGTAYMAQLMGIGASLGPWGIVAAAVIAAIMAAIGSQKPSVGPLGGGNFKMENGQAVPGTYGSDNEFSEEASKQMAQMAATAYQGFLTVSGGKVKKDYAGQDSRLSYYQKDNEWKSLVGGVEKTFKDQGEALVDMIKRTNDLYLSKSLLTIDDANVKTAMANSKAKDPENYLKDIGAARTYTDVQKYTAQGYNPFTEQIKAWTDAAKEDGKKAKEQYVDIFDRVVALGIDTATSARAKLVEIYDASLGLGKTFEPLVGLNAELKRTEINIEAYKEVWTGLGLTAEQQTTRINQLIQLTKDNYDLAVASYERPARIAIEQAANSSYRASSVDVLRGVGIDQQAQGKLQPFVAAFATFYDAAATGTATADQMRGTFGALTEQLRAGLVTGDQYKALVQALTGAWQDNSKAVEKATQAAAESLTKAQAMNAANLSVMTRANTALGRTYRSALDQFDSTALKDVLDTANAGGDVGLLVATQAVERQKTGLDAIEQMMQREIDARQQSVQSIQATVQAWDGLVDGLKDTRASLKIDQNLSTLSPLERMNEAQKQLADLYTKAANDNDVDAARKFQSLTSGALEATKGYYASSTAYATYFSTVDTQLGTLIDKFGDASDPQRELVKQAESQTKALQDQLTNLRAQRAAIERTPVSIDALTAATTTGLADLKTAMGALAERFPQSAGNNPVSNGLVQAIFRAATAEQGYKGVTSELDGHKVDANRFIDIARALGYAGSVGGGQLSQYIFANADFRRRLNEALTTYESASAAGLIGKVGYELGGIVGAYATGGVVGNGLWGKDSVVAQYAGGGKIALAGGEGVLTAAATAAIGSGTVDYINRNLALPANDRWIGVAEYRRPAEASSPRADNRGVEQRLDRVCSLLERLLGVSAKAGDRTLDRLDALLDVAEEQVAHQSLKGAKAA